MILGATATIVNDGCMTPWDVIKQRMQVSHSPFRSLAHCISDTWRQGGLAAFYKSYWTTVSFRRRLIHLFSLSGVFLVVFLSFSRVFGAARIVEIYYYIFLL